MAIPARFSKLVSELVAIEWSVCSTGHIQMEPKEDIKKRLGHSPDQADALALTYANPFGWLFRKMFGDGSGTGGRFSV